MAGPPSGAFEKAMMPFVPGAAVSVMAPSPVMITVPAEMNEAVDGQIVVPNGGETVMSPDEQ